MEQQDIVTCWVMTPVIIFIIYLFYWGFYGIKKEQEQEDKRINEIKDYSTSNGFEFFLNGGNFSEIAKDFMLTNANNNDFYVMPWLAENHGIKNGFEFYLVDHRYYNRKKKNESRTHTLCLLINKNVKIPDFYIRNRTFFLDDLERLLGGKEIRIADDKEFSKKFFIQSDNEDEVKDFFNSDVRKLFLEYHKNNYEFEFKNNSLIVLKKGTRNFFDTCLFIPLKERIQLLENSVNFLQSIKNIKLS